MFRILNHRQKNHFYANKKVLRGHNDRDLCIRTYEYVQNFTYVFDLDIQTRFFQMFIDSNRKKRR